MSALFPDFLIIALGALIGSRIAGTGWRQIDWLSYYVLYPALLFSAAARRPISVDALLTIGLLACLIVTAGLLLSLCVKKLSYEISVPTRGGISQNAWRFNTALGFVAVATLPAEAMGILAITVGLAIPLANFYAVLSMARHQGRSSLTMVQEIVFNPFLLASAAGVLAARYGGDRSKVAVAVMQSTALGLITLPLWSVLAMRVV